MYVCDQGPLPLSQGSFNEDTHTHAHTHTRAGSEQHCREQLPGQSEMSLLPEMGGAGLLLWRYLSEFPPSLLLSFVLYYLICIALLELTAKALTVEAKRPAELQYVSNKYANEAPVFLQSV